MGARRRSGLNSEAWGPVTDELARRLIGDAFPQAAGQTVTRFASGMDNDIFAVGDRWLARLPRHDFGRGNIEREILLLPSLPDLDLSLPQIVAVGEATSEYPSRFLLLNRLTGDQPGLQDRFVEDDARALGLALRRLHEAPRPGWLSGDVHGLFRAGQFLARLEQVLPIVSEADRLEFEPALRELIEPSEDPLENAEAWVHGDLHIRNLLCREGRLSGIVDWGDSHCGHPTHDLMAAYALFEPATREVFFEAYGPVPESWRSAARKQAAITTFVLLKANSEENAKEVPRQSLRRILA
ncbi:hypothetical protein EON81_09275 [bacterium]|nr:MAG: hypothetical protein EON81_09275 [bacterium]